MLVARSERATLTKWRSSAAVVRRCAASLLLDGAMLCMPDFAAHELPQPNSRLSFLSLSLGISLSLSSSNAFSSKRERERKKDRTSADGNKWQEGRGGGWKEWKFLGKSVD